MMTAEPGSTQMVVMHYVCFAYSCVPFDSKHVRVVDNTFFFKMGTERWQSYARQHTLRVQDVRPGDDTYVVVSIDPAGGGTLSEEAFVAFLVDGAKFGLLTARLVPGHNERYGFSSQGGFVWVM